MTEVNNATHKWLLTPGLEQRCKDFLILYATAFRNPVKRRRPLLIQGDPGVGKSMFTYIFETLYRDHHPGGLAVNDVKRVNVAALAENLFESEIFGYVKGAFTGANKIGKEGFLENTKLLILEEIGELSKPTQAKLLTFLEDGIYYRVGSTEQRKAADDIQIIATTNAPLDTEHFRQDFLDRCYTFTIPALYQRRKDILYILACLYPDCFSLLSPTNVTTILAHNWPGNMRELEKYGVTMDGSFCRNGFGILIHRISLLETFDLMKINIDRLYQFLNVAYLSIDFLRFKEFRLRQEQLQKSALPEFRPSTASIEALTDIAYICENTNYNSFDDANPIEKAMCHFAYFVALLFNGPDFNCNLLDVDDSYKNSFRVPPIFVQDDVFRSWPAPSEEFREDIDEWFQKALTFVDLRPRSKFERKMMISDLSTETEEDPMEYESEVPPDAPSSKTEVQMLKSFYQKHLALCNGNVAEVARHVGVNRKTLDGRLIKLGIHPTRKK
jgi:transcriptional regulator with AAA-type ATPase domain